jgi:hypothetical protein
MVESIASKLKAPLTITVAGGVSSGKSTLVNALLGQCIAAVDAGECTRVVSEFRYDNHERAVVNGTDGTSTTLPLNRGQMPDDLGRPTSEIASVTVYLSNALLQQIAVVDTPGLNTITEANEVSATNFLGVSGQGGQQTATAVSRADALVFLLPMLRQADAEVLKGFAKLFGGSSLSSASAVGVLSKVDRLHQQGDALAAAAPIAQRVADELRGIVNTVVPVIGLLAQSAHAAVFTEADARSLLVVAGITDELDREDMLLSVEDFLQFEGLDLERAQRLRLVSLLDLYGLRSALQAADHGARSASAFLQHFDAVSGFAALRSAVIDRFAAQSDVFKAHAALHDLRRASYLRTDTDNQRALRALRSPLERIELDPAMHHVRLLDVARLVAAGELMLPPALLADVAALTMTTDAATTIGSNALQRQDEAAAGAARWSTWINDARRAPDEVRHGRAVKEAFEMLWTTFAGRPT